MLCDELKGCKKNMLQERLCLLVHVRRQVLDVQRLEILALASLTEANEKAVLASLESYRRKVFGKLPTQKEEWIDNAKKQLADEAKKVYIVTQRTGKGQQDLQVAAQSKNPEVAKMAQMLLRNEAQAMTKLHARAAVPLPAGVVAEKR